MVSKLTALKTKQVLDEHHTDHSSAARLVYSIYYLST